MTDKEELQYLSHIHRLCVKLNRAESKISFTVKPISKLSHYWNSTKRWLLKTFKPIKPVGFYNRSHTFAIAQDPKRMIK